MGTICSRFRGGGKVAQQVDSNPTAENVAAAVNIPSPATKSQEVPKEETEVINSDEEVKEFSLCKVDDLKENELKVFDVEDSQVLVVKEKGSVYAMGTKCTHYGAPLSSGIFCNGKVYCPWHGACFSALTGDIEEFPALDPIPTYKTQIDQNTSEVKINVSAKMMKQNLNVIKPLCKSDGSNQEIVVIIGSGAAGHSCAETLRQEGYTGRVLIVTKEKYLPYDRPKLSKVMNLDGHKLALRSEEYYKSGDIDIVKEVSVKSVDIEAKTILLRSGDTLPFTYLVLATGGRPRPLPCPGTHLANVCLLRTPDEANYIAETAQGRHVVIVGTSFIGMEAAAYLVDKAASVTVVGRDPAPFAPIFGIPIGKRLQALHEEKGVHFIFEVEVAELHGDEEGKLSEVKLTTGQLLRADLLLTGLGVVPCTDFLRGSDVLIDRRGYVPVDQFMRTNCEKVYAAGDIASFPQYEGDLDLGNVGHWQMALHHGRTVALDILGRSRPIYETAVPFFWSSMFGKSIRFCGYSSQHDDIIIHGDLENLKFAAFFCKGDIVRGIATLNYDPLTIQFSALLGSGKKLLKADIKLDPTGWVSQL